MKRFLSCFLSVCLIMSIGIFNAEATTYTYICNVDFNSASGSCTTASGKISGLDRMFLYAVANNTTSIVTPRDNRYVSFDYTGTETSAKPVGNFKLNEDEILDGNYSISFDYNNISALSSFDIQVDCFEKLQSSYVPLTINSDGSVTFVGSEYTNTGITKGDWHTIVMNFNTGTQIATLTVDGAKVAEVEWTYGGIKHTTGNAAVYFRTTRVSGGSNLSTIYFDNLKMYNISYNGAVSSIQSNACYVDTNAIDMPIGTTYSDLINALSVPDTASVKLVDTNGATVTSMDSAAYVVITSNNGLVVEQYAINPVAVGFYTNGKMTKTLSDGTNIVKLFASNLSGNYYALAAKFDADGVFTGVNATSLTGGENKDFEVSVNSNDKTLSLLILGDTTLTPAYNEVEITR